MSSYAGSNGSPYISRTPAADVTFTSIDAGSHGESTRSRRGSKSSNERRSSSFSDRSSRRGPLHATSISGVIQSGLGTIARHAKRPGGLLRDPSTTSARPSSSGESSSNSKRWEINGGDHAGRNFSAQQLSGESSQRGSSLLGDPTSKQENGQSDADSRLPPIDPAQLVQMALDLSESRKRVVSNTLHAAGSPNGAKRMVVVSGPGAGYGTVRAMPPLGYMGGGRPSPKNRGIGGRDSQEGQAMDTDEDLVYTFTPATLYRAEKACRYFELASEHRRLLEHLPPLRADHDSGARVVSIHDNPYQNHHNVGREYNPLQALRNRRLRARGRIPFVAPPDVWMDTDRTKRWIDRVVAVSEDTAYGRADPLRMPRFEGELKDSQARPGTANGHRRNDTSSSIITKPETGWSIEPAELLADAYWTEIGDNKKLIEDRRGRHISAARRRRKSESKGAVKVPVLSSIVPQQHDHNADDNERPRSHHKTILHVPERIRRPLMHRSMSSTSNSSLEAGTLPAHKSHPREAAGDEFVGPLERHMQDLIAKDERGELSSPELHPFKPADARPSTNRAPIDRPSTDRASVDSFSRVSNELSNGERSSLNHERLRSMRAQEASPVHAHHAMSSADQPVPSVPNSPSMNSFSFPPKAHSGLSPADGLPLQEALRREGARHPRKNLSLRKVHAASGSEDAAVFGAPLSPVISADDPTGKGDSIFATERPPKRRHKTNEIVGEYDPGLSNDQDACLSSKGGTEKMPTASTGHRILKGRRIGDIVRHEGARFGERLRGQRDKGNGRLGGAPGIARNASSETDDDSVQGRQTSVGETTDLESEKSPRASIDTGRPTPRYYLPNLPSFRSPAPRERRGVATPPSAESELFVHKQKLSQTGPLQNEHDMATDSAERQGAGIDVNEVLSPDSKGSSEARGGSVGQERYVPAEIRNVGTDESRLGSRGSMVGKVRETKRHWSISDALIKQQPVITRVTTRDTARVRALLLASGIKAHEIWQLANTSRGPASPLFLWTAKTVSKTDLSDWKNVPRNREHVEASRSLAMASTKQLEEFEASSQHFRTQTVALLVQRLSDIRSRVSDQLTVLAHETADDADGFTVELTTKQPQDLKRVDDAIDAMHRQRRRQFRFIRRAGFKTLELVLLSVMWWLWFIVMLINSTRKVIVGVAQAVKWLVWF